LAGVFRLPVSGLNSQTVRDEDGINFSLYVAANFYRQKEDGLERGIRVLELPSLRGNLTYTQKKKKKKISHRH